jgi:hypothetical protein
MKSLRAAAAVALAAAILAGSNTAHAADNDIDGDGVPDLVLGAVAWRGFLIIDRSASPDLVLSPRMPEIRGRDWTGFGRALTIADFDGDGYSDVAVGGHRGYVPFLGVSLLTNVVTVIYGSPGPITRSKLLSPSTSTAFGTVLTSGDFNGDGFGDLAAWDAGDHYLDYRGNGLIRIYYGGVDGLSAVRRQELTQATPGIPGESEKSDAFGSSMAAGSVDGDAYDDLVIGVPYEDVGEVSNAGSVVVVRGSVFGLVPSWSSRWSKGSSQLGGRPTDNDLVGSSLCIGDFDGDSFGDIGIGVRKEDVGVMSDAGAVRVLRGSAHGPTNVGRQLWMQNSRNVEGRSEPYDEFGDACAAGDFNDDGFDDLIASAPRDFRDSGRGVVHVLFGSPAGLSAFGDRFIDPPAANAHLGWDLAAFDVDGDGIDDALVTGGPADMTFVLISSGGTPPFATTTMRAGDPGYRFTLQS